MKLRWLAVALLPFAAACEDDAIGITPPSPDAGNLGCISDAECGPRERCNVALRVCLPRDACQMDGDCPQQGQVCRDDNGDGFNDCVFERCDRDRDCASLMCSNGQIPRCVAGGCLCGDPCQGGCPASQGCCVPEDRCYDLPVQCRGLACRPGEFVSVTSTGAWDTGTCQVVGEACRCEKLPPLALGDIGLHSAVAHDGSAAMVSAYNLDYGDLMVGMSQADGSIRWEFVDGVPTSTRTITGDVDGPRGGQSAPGNDVGLYTDIAVDAGGRPHIVYHDRTEGALKYAVLTPGGWNLHTIERTGGSGYYASLSFSRTGQPRVAFLTLRESMGATRVSTLKLATTTQVMPTATADWMIRNIEQLDLSAYGCREQCREDEVCRASNLSCVVPDPASACPMACASGTRCIGGRCALIEPLPPFRDLPLARGLWPSIAVLPDGTVLVAYHDRVDNSLKVARVEGPNPGVGAARVFRIAGGTEDEGHFPSLFVTPGGEIHLVSMNATRRSVVYRALNPSLQVTAEETIESGLGMGSTPYGDRIGADPAIVVDAAGTIRVAYQNASSGELRYARRMGPNQWVIAVLRGNEQPYAGSFGFYTDQALTPDRMTPVVSTYRYLLRGPPGNGVVVLTPP